MTEHGRRLAFGSHEAMVAAQDHRLDLKERVEAAIVDLWGRLGHPPEVARQRMEKEFARVIPKTVLAELAALGISVADKRVLDLGAGLGGLSVELDSQGGRVVALEPDSVWCTLTRDRLKQSSRGAAVEAAGENLPFADSSFDLIVSLQVLEHVRDPARVLSEVCRVLRPGGFFYLACANYLVFREPHYEVAWLPLLPKPLGALYLRLRGRSPEFLWQAVTYVTPLSVRRDARSAGFDFVEDEALRAKLVGSAAARPAIRIARILSKRLSGKMVLRLLIAMKTCRTLFRQEIDFILQKPLGSQDHPKDQSVNVS